jgi:hypothetical protein
MDSLVPADFEITPEHRNLMLQRIQERVLYLLQQDMPFLLNSLYRMDVPESRLQQAMKHHTDLSSVASDLAEAIYNRELQKQITRKKYASPKPTDTDIELPRLE